MTRAVPAALLILASLLFAQCEAASPPVETVKLFDYDAKAPLDVQQIGVEERDGVSIHDLTYASPKGGRVPTYLVVPKGKGPFPAVILMHGAPGTRARMLPQALTMAKSGAVALLIDAPFARSGAGSETITFTELDRDRQIQLIVDLRRAVDLLAARSDVDAKRIAYLGRSYGAAMGGLLAGVETRIKAYILAVGDGGLVSHFTGEDDRNGPLQGLSEERRKRWLAAMEPIEPIRFVGNAAPAALFFQAARQDELVPPADATRFQEAGSEPKTVKWYDSGHQLNQEALRDGLEWLRGQIGIDPPAPAVKSAQGVQSNA